LPKSRLIRMIKATKRVYEAAVNLDADIYHIHDPELLPYALKLIKKGKRVIFDSHENYTVLIRCKYYIPRLLRNIISNLYNRFETFTIKRIDAAIIPCKFNGRNIFQGIAKKTVFIDNVPILSNTSFKYLNERSSQTPSVCYVGGLTYERGITYLTKAVSKAKVRLILGGKFLPVNYQKEVMEMPEAKWIDYRGYLDRENVIKAYSDSMIGICTILNIGQYNTGDNFATKVYDYMSMGLPVIITDSPYARKVMEEYEFGVCVQPDNVEEIASVDPLFAGQPRSRQTDG
jgi:glycosyltransferase involved in cell wall biosynthesis